jgi:hypothetical protein
MELNKSIGINSLTSQYRIKVAYMLMWMRLIPIKKRTLKGWSMPDMSTIQGFTNQGAGNCGSHKGDDGKNYSKTPSHVQPSAELGEPQPSAPIICDFCHKEITTLLQKSPKVK